MIIRPTLDQVRRLTKTMLLSRGYSDWSVDFAPFLDKPGRLGMTNFQTGGIWYATDLLRELHPVQARDVVAHEVSHVVAGLEAAHGPLWRSICIQMGGTGEEFWWSSPREFDSGQPERLDSSHTD